MIIAPAKNGANTIHGASCKISCGDDIAYFPLNLRLDLGEKIRLDLRYTIYKERKPI